MFSHWASRRLSAPRLAEKVAIKKQVQRGDKTFEQTFWVSPEEAKEHHADSHAKSLIAKAQAKGIPLQRLAESVQREARRVGESDPAKANHLHRLSWVLEEHAAKRQAASPSQKKAAPRTKAKTKKAKTKKAKTEKAKTKSDKATKPPVIKWQKDPSGGNEHSMTGLPKGEAKLKKTGKRWEVHYGGKVVTLPTKKATFTHAERAIAGMLKEDLASINAQRDALVKWAKRRGLKPVGKRPS